MFTILTPVTNLVLIPDLQAVNIAWMEKEHRLREKTSKIMQRVGHVRRVKEYMRREYEAGLREEENQQAKSRTRVPRRALSPDHSRFGSGAGTKGVFVIALPGDGARKTEAPDSSEETGDGVRKVEVASSDVRVDDHAVRMEVVEKPTRSDEEMCIDDVMEAEACPEDDEVDEMLNFILRSYENEGEEIDEQIFDLVNNLVTVGMAEELEDA
jgi:hypothetical protein